MKHQHKSVLPLFTSALFFSHALLYCKDFRHETLSVEHGLSQSSVWAIMQDRDGFLWIGTADGLNRYDGYTFQVFRHSISDSFSLPNNNVNALLEARDGLFWIGTYNGVCTYDRRSGRFKRLADEARYKDSYLRARTTSILEDRTGLLWFGTMEGLARMDPSSGKVDHFPSPGFKPPGSYNFIGTLLEDGDGSILMGDGVATYRFERQSGKISSVSNGVTSGLTTTATFKDHEGNLWFGTRQGVFSVDHHKKEWRSHRIPTTSTSNAIDNIVRAIGEDNTGRMWFGGITKGLYYFDRTNQEFRSFKPSMSGAKNAHYEGVSTIFRDRSGLMWIGYDGAGLVKINPARDKFDHILLPPSRTNSTGDNFFKSLMVDHSGRVWLGTYDQGVAVLDRKTGIVQRYPHRDHDPNSLTANTVFALLEDREENVWVGTIAGIDRFDARTSSFHHITIPGVNINTERDRIVTALCEDSTGTIWCGTASQLMKFEKTPSRFETVFRSPGSSEGGYPQNITVILPDADELWIGTLGGGLLRLKRNGSIVRRFLHSPGRNSLSHNAVKTILKSPDGIFWIGTEEGLNRYDSRTDTWRTYRTVDGLPNDFIYGVLMDRHGHLWISTNKGISRMDIRDPERPQFRNYTPDDGLQSYEFNTGAYFQTPEGEMLFGGVNGFNAFFPDSIHDNANVPPVVLSGFKKFDQPVHTGGDINSRETLSLDFSETVFSFEFAALEFTNPRRNQYSYMMEGFDKTWVHVGTWREARYTNLDPGTYMFRVKGSNNDGVWNETGTAIKVVVVPPFWKTWWFTGLVALFGISTFGAMVRFISVQKLKRRVEQLEREKAIQDERMKTRERIARDLHDDLASTVGSAGLFIESVKNQLKDIPLQAREFLDKTSSLLTEAEEAMSDIVWSVSPKHDTLESLLSRIRLTTADVCRANGIRHDTVLDASARNYSLDEDTRRTAYLVFKEAMTNVARHSEASTVRVTFLVQGEHFTLSIEDNGKGITSSNQSGHPTKRGHGLRNMAKRAEEVGAEFIMGAASPSGTIITLKGRITQTGH